jgi:hypothetical protein
MTGSALRVDGAAPLVALCDGGPTGDGHVVALAAEPYVRQLRSRGGQRSGCLPLSARSSRRTPRKECELAKCPCDNALVPPTGRDDNSQGADCVWVRLLGTFSLTLGNRAAGPWARPSARRLCELVLVSPGRRIGREAACEALFPHLGSAAGSKRATEGALRREDRSVGPG